MNKSMVVTILFLITYVSDIRADIVSHASLAPLVDYIAQVDHENHDILVIFDIDNTIAHPKTEVGSDQWIEYMAKQLVENGVSVAQAFQSLLPLYFKIQHIIDLDLVEDMIPELIIDLKSRGIHVIGLTARSQPIMDRTLAQLASLKVQFSDFSTEEITLKGDKNPVIYKNGIIFCGDSNKGKTLFKFLKLFNFLPKKIFFIDDKMHHLMNVEKLTLERGIECICIHYTRCQERVENFNPEQANREMCEFAFNEE